MGGCTRVRRCLICHRSRLKDSSEDSEKLVSNASVLQNFLHCFHVNVLDSEVHDLSTSCQFCQSCEQFIAEWSSIQTQMTQLTRRGAQLEATLSALLLYAPPIQEQNHDEDVAEINKNRIQNYEEVQLPLRLQQTVDDIRNELRKKYLVNVMVDKIQVPCPPADLNQEEWDPLSGHQNDDGPMDDWRGDDESDAEYQPSENQMDDEETSDQIVVMRINTEEEDLYDDSDGPSEYSVDLTEINVNRKSKIQSKVRKKSPADVKRKRQTHPAPKKQRKRPENAVVIPDGPNTFKYNGHGLKLNDEDQCYYCSACDFKGSTKQSSILIHIRATHYTEEDKLKFTAIKTSDTEWLYGGVYKIISVGEKFKCVTCGFVSSNVSWLVQHVRSQHVDREGSEVVVPVPVTNTPIVTDSTPIQGVYKSIPYTFNPVNNKYTCGICKAEIYLRKNFGQHTIKYHRAGTRKKHNPVVIPDGPNRFKYHGHPLKLNVTNQCYYCGACDYQGNTHLSSILGHIRHRHYTEEDKRKFTAVKISEGAWLFGGEHKIIKSGGKFQCVSCGVMNTQVNGLIEHIRNEHADLEGPDERVVVPVSETPSIIDSTPIQGQLKSVPYTFNPADNEYTCGICQSQVGPRNCFLSHIKELHPEKQPKQPEHTVVVPDGPNTFKYNGHGLKLNDEDQCYYCSACDFKGRVKQSSILTHIRATHYTEEDKLKFTAVKTSDTEWLYGGLYKIITAGEKFKCVTCGYVGTRITFLVQHIRSQHVDREGSEVVVPVPVTDTPIVTDSTPIQGVYKSVPYTFNPVNNKYTCGICKVEIYLRNNFRQHIIKYHRAGTRKKHNSVVNPDGPNTFKYHGHPLKLNVANQCYYCGTCDFQGNTHMSSVLGHIRHRHYTEEEKQKFTAVKTSEGEWLYGGEHKIIKVDGKFKCVSCGVMNTQVYGLIEHIRKEHADLEGPDDGDTVPVPETPSVIDSTPIQGELQAVPYKFNPIDNEYTCGICESQVGPRNCFLSHIKELHPDNRPKHQHFAIPDGPNTFNYNGHGLKLNDEDQCYYCGACGFKGKTYINSVLRHIREMHYTPEDKVKFTAVPVTDTEWLYGGSFKIIRVGEMFKCVSCGCVKSRLSVLSGHIRSEHFDVDGNPQEVPLPVTAPPTASDATPIQGVYRSVPYTFNSADNMYTCGMCHSPVSSIHKQIRRHIRECHLDAAPVICEICGKELSNQRGYRSHVRRHKAEPQSCPTCDKTIYCPRRFRLHLKVHAFGDAAKKYQCEFCGKKFMCRSHYTNHVPVHTGEMRFVCEACGRKFRYAAELSAHRKSEHGIAGKTRKMLRINE